MAERLAPRAALRTSLAMLVVLATLSSGDAALALQPPNGVPGNRLVNPGAEQGSIAAWSGGGFRAALYGESGVPASAYAQANNYGSALFVAESSGAALTQTVDLSDVAASTDTGQQRFIYGGALGGQSGRDDGARLSLQPLDTGGSVIGPALVVGPPSDADRGGQTTLLDCRMLGTLPPGTRRAHVTLDASGSAQPVSTAIADGLFLTTENYGPYPGGPPPPAYAPGCFRPPVELEPPPPPSPFVPPSPGLTPRRVPRLATLVSMPSRSRCRTERSLSFRVRPAWRTRVARLTARARDRSESVAAPRLSRAIRVRAPRRSLRVRLTVRLSDGRTRTGSMRYRSCGRSR